MAGNSRGMVMLPDIDTEVVLAFAYRSMSPYVLGAVYNGGADTPDPYANEDGNNDKRVFWSRSDHMVVFDDTEGKEQVALAAKAGGQLDASSGVIYQTADASEKVLTTYAEKHIILEAKGTISVKCKDFELKTDKTVAMEAGQKSTLKSGSQTLIKASNKINCTASNVSVNPPGSLPEPKPAETTPTHRHPPMK